VRWMASSTRDECWSAIFDSDDDARGRRWRWSSMHSCFSWGDGVFRKSNVFRPARLRFGSLLPCTKFLRILGGSGRATSYHKYGSII
jgi:hypothetical protein